MKLSHIHRLVHFVPERELSFAQIGSALRKAFKPYPWIRFVMKVVADESETLTVSGLFEPDYCDRSVCFITITHFTEHPKHPIWFFGRLRTQVLFDVFTTIAHERVHLLQDRKAQGCPRLYRVKTPLHPTLKQQHEYYGSNIEIDAFGLTAALEQAYGYPEGTLKQYRHLFAPADPRYKRFLKKRWEYGLTLPPKSDINRVSMGVNHGRECRTRRI